MAGIPPGWDGSLPAHQVMPGESYLYEFDAEPFGLHLYHCHANPLKRHVHKGLYGAFIIDPPSDVLRPPADELVMVLNGFDTNFDADNEVYAANTVASFYMQEPNSRAGRSARADVCGQPDGVRSDQQPAPARDVLRCLSHRHVADAVRVDRHHHVLPGASGRFSRPPFAIPATSCSTAIRASSPSWGWMGLFRAEGNRDT